MLVPSLRATPSTPGLLQLLGVAEREEPVRESPDAQGGVPDARAGSFLPDGLGAGTPPATRSPPTPRRGTTVTVLEPNYVQAIGECAETNVPKKGFSPPRTTSSSP